MGQDFFWSLSQRDTYLNSFIFLWKSANKYKQYVKMVLIGSWKFCQWPFRLWNIFVGHGTVERIKQDSKQRTVEMFEFSSFVYTLLLVNSIDMFISEVAHIRLYISNQSEIEGCPPPPHNHLPPGITPDQNASRPVTTDVIRVWCHPFTLPSPHRALVSLTLPKWYYSSGMM